MNVTLIGLLVRASALLFTLVGVATAGKASGVGADLQTATER